MGKRWERKSSITSKLQTAMLFLCFAFLLIASLGPPVYRGFRLAGFELRDRPSKHTDDTRVFFGPFGYCTDSNACSRAGLGYDLAGVLTMATGYSDYSRSLNGLSKMLVMIPVTCGLSFLGFLISAFGGHIGSAIWAAIFGIVINFCCILCIVAVQITMGAALLAIRKTNAEGKAGPGYYLVIIATILSGFGWILGIIECCLARKHKKMVGKTEYVAVGVVPTGYRGSESLVENAAPIGVQHIHNYRDPYVDVPTPSNPTHNKRF